MSETVDVITDLGEFEPDATQLEATDRVVTAGALTAGQRATSEALWGGGYEVTDYGTVTNGTAPASYQTTEIGAAAGLAVEDNQVYIGVRETTPSAEGRQVEVTFARTSQTAVKLAS